MTNDDEAEVRQRAAEIATRGLVHDGDLLLACRDLAALRDQLHWVPEEVLDPIVAVASETDDFR